MICKTLLDKQAKPTCIMKNIITMMTYKKEDSLKGGDRSLDIYLPRNYFSHFRTSKKRWKR